mgnify:CR=1 FL=1
MKSRNEIALEIFKSLISNNTMTDTFNGNFECMGHAFEIADKFLSMSGEEKKPGSDDCDFFEFLKNNLLMDKNSGIPMQDADGNYIICAKAEIFPITTLAEACSIFIKRKGDGK